MPTYSYAEMMIYLKAFHYIDVDKTMNSVVILFG